MQILQEALKCMKGLSASNAHDRGICCPMRIWIRQLVKESRTVVIGRSLGWWFEQTPTMWYRSEQGLSGDFGQ